MYLSTLKCIGGKCDGKPITLNDYYYVGQIVKIPKFKPVAEFDLSVLSPSSIIKIHYCKYRICVLNFSQTDKYYFLCPSNWEDRTAILYQFAK